MAADGARLAASPDMRPLALGLVLLAGCSLYPFDGDGDDVCVQRDLAQPAPERRVNPSTLSCEEFFTGGTCNAECGPCPLTGQGGAPQYIPPWGHCESACTALDEAACEAASDCRVARNWERHFQSRPSFAGCYERTSSEPGLVPAVCDGLDAEQCSREGECAGLYRIIDGAATPSSPRAEFRQCVDEDQLVGTCSGQVACRALPPTCPAYTTPGVANGCWTGSCIPDELCTPGI